MTVTIRHWKNTQEADLIKAFCRWQNIKCEVIDNIHRDVMIFTNGRGIPVIYEGDVIIAVGFHKFYTYLQKQGMFLC